MNSKHVALALWWIPVVLVPAVVLAQPDFQRTVVVDPNGLPDANEDDIQDAIDAIGTPAAGEYWTVLIYPGVYTIDGTNTELIHLDGGDERISLVGVDRQSVIINVTALTGSGIKITSGTESSRECRIANLTIKTINGHGIEIVKGGGGGDKTPKDIRIEGVTIEANGAGNDGISGSAAESVQVVNCDVTSDDGDGVVSGNDWLLTDTTIEALSEDAAGIRVGAYSGARAERCVVAAEDQALHLASYPVSFSAIDSTFTGGVAGTWPVIDENAQQFTFQNCSFIGDATLRAGAPGHTSGVYIDVTAGHSQHDNFAFRFVNCRMAATTDSSSAVARGVDSDGHFPFVFVGCDISAVNDSGEAYGVSTQAGKIVLIGGVVTSKSGDEKETEVWDLFNPGGANDEIKISGTRCSKWKGPIVSAERPRPIVQRTVTVASADDDGILIETDLTDSEQPLTSGFSQPDEFRCLSIKGNTAGMDLVVYIIGTNWAGDQIAEKIQLSGTTEVKGSKPFKTVSKIILPGTLNVNWKVRVGTTDRLGLYYPISATTDVLQQGRKASAATSYTLETVGSPDATYSWVAVSSPAVSGNDSFEWAILASQ